MCPKSRQQGFTYIEILVVLAVLMIVATLSSVSFQHMQSKAAREAGANELFNALNDARTKTLAHEQSSVYGVHVSSTTITRFMGSTFIPGASGNKVYVFEHTMRATSTLFDASGTTTVFTRLTGVPSVSGTIYVYDENGTGTSTIVLHKSGLVEYE